MAKKLKKGLLITFEGPEGCGKSTHSRRLFDELKAEGYAVIITSEPGATVLGARIREILLEREDVRFRAHSELFLFEADRAEHMDEVIIPALKSGKLVICDRFSTATFAYQGYGLGLDLGEIEAVNAVATRGVVPDLTVLLDVDVAAGLKRIGIERSADKMERRGTEFHQRVREGYLSLAKNGNGHITLIDAGKGIDEVYKNVKETVYGFIEGDSGTE